MHLARRLIPLAVVLALSLTSFGASAAAPPATLPTWHLGQTVAYGTTLNLTALFDTYVKPFILMDQSNLNITTINALDFTGTLDIWTVDNVTQVTPTYYVLSEESASGLQLSMDVNLTMKGLPKPGTYPGTPSGYGFCIPPAIPTTNETVAVQMDGKILSATQRTIYQNVSTLAYVNETSSTATKADFSVAAHNVPTVSTNETSCVVTVAYEDPAFTLTADTHEDVRILYQPMWDYFNFPISDNETWWANTTARVGATLSGTVDVQGLSAADEASFFDNVTKAFQSAGLAVSGLTHFPIDLSQITITAGIANLVQNGVLLDTPIPLDTNLRATASAQSLSDGSIHPVYLITDASYSCPTSGNLTLPVGYAAVYAPDFPAPGAGMIAGYELLICVGSESLPGFGLTNTRPADARKNIGRTESTYNPFPPPPATNALADFFVKSPYWGILILVAVVVVAVAAVLVLRRRRAARQPPSPPPPGPGTP